MKKRRQKQIAAFACALLATTYISAPVLALESVADTPLILSEALNESSREWIIDPRFEHMSRISSSLSMGTFGRANCTGSFTTYDEYDSTMFVVLQQFKDNRWNEYQSWSESYSSSGAKLLEKGYYVSSGYRYRVVTTVVIYGNDGRELERVSCDSPIKEY